MKKRGLISSRSIVTVGLLAVVAARAGFGQDTQFAAEQPTQTLSPVRVLVITGGHPYEETAFTDVFRSMKTISFKEARLGGEAELLLKPEPSKNYDVLVFYDMNQNCEPYLNDLISLLKSGKGVVFLHHALGSCSENDEYGYLVGGRAQFRPSAVFTAKYKGNTSYRAHIEDPACPITTGVSDFDMTDEVYSDYFVNSGSHVFLTPAIHSAAANWRGRGISGTRR